MATPRSALTPARDSFERYYAEKLWDWIPAVYRDRDGLEPNPGVLRALVEILARQAAISRRSIDRLWEDQYIEVCDDWAIPYIGDLVGTRLVHELNRRGRRVDVARTIFYRRCKGTPLVLEVLIRDITGWSGVVVEAFRRLARTRHRLDPEPGNLGGRLTGSPPGGWAALRSVRGAQLVDGPFDEFAHTADCRQLDGTQGRYNIPKLNVHLFRLRPFDVAFATPLDFGDGRFTFDPSGRDIPLFRPDQRPAPTEWHPPRPWEVPAPITCRLLGAATYTITAEAIDALVDQGLPSDAADELARYTGVPFDTEARLRDTLGSLVHGGAMLSLLDPLLGEALAPDAPKGKLLPRAIAVSVGPVHGSPPIERQRIASGNLVDWGASLGMLPPEKRLVIDPERGRFWFPAPEATVWVPRYHYGFSGAIGAGPYDRRATIAPSPDTIIPNGGDGDPGPVPFGVGPLIGTPGVVQIVQIDDSKTYLPDDDLTGLRETIFQAANFQRPYVKRVASGSGEWIFQADPKLPVPADGPEPPSNRRTLTIDGLWIGVEPAGLVPVPEPCPPTAAYVVLEGAFDRVVIRHCTLDPGGEQARLDAGECRVIPSVVLMVRGTVQELIVESSILGPIVENGAASDPGVIQSLTVKDSIIHSLDPETTPAIHTGLGTVRLERVTVLGEVLANRLYASEALIQGLVRITDSQHGCFRFSATNRDPLRRLPPLFESHLIDPAIPNHVLVSRRFGDPGYAQLSETAPEAIVRGAENRSEIGAFSRLLTPIKRDDLAAKVNEFIPFGLIAQYINET